MEALDVIANNLANANTVGFKEERTFFSLLNQTLDAPEASELNAAINNQSILLQAAVDFTPGSQNRTGRDLDVALSGEGLLVVETPQGIRYTRSGSLALNGKSVVTTPAGYPVLGE